MNFQSGSIYHVYNQGNNKEPIFFNNDNYIYFLKKIRSSLIPHTDLLAYCLMPNHYHWLIHVKEEKKKESSHHHPLVRKIATLQSSYTQAVNKQENRSGSLFRRKSKAKKIEELEYALTCFLYIHQNPLRAKLANNLKDWMFSSYRDYVGIRKGDLCNMELAKELFELPNSTSKFEEFSIQTIPDHYLNKIY